MHYDHAKCISSMNSIMQYQLSTVQIETYYYYYYYYYFETLLRLEEIENKSYFDYCKHKNNDFAIEPQ